MTVLCRQSSYHRAWSVSNVARSLRPCVAVSSPGADIWEKNNKIALEYEQFLTTLEAAGSILTYAHIPSPHWRQRRKSHCDAIEITLRQGHMVKWLFVISYGSLLTFSDNLTYISKGMRIFLKYFLGPPLDPYRGIHFEFQWHQLKS